jgi:hypothetical protein
MGIYDGDREFSKLGFQSRWETLLDESEQRVD